MHFMFLILATLQESRLAVRVTGRLEPRLARKLARQLRAVLERSRARVVLAIESRRNGDEIERLARALARYGDRASIVLGPGLNRLLRLT
jgi:hypothetical protein